MTAAKKPQDHLGKVEPFTFAHEGVQYVLPPPSDSMGRVPGRVLRDAVMGGEDQQAKLNFTILESVDADPAAINALYSKSVVDMSKIMERWLRSSGPDGENLPES